MGATHTYRYIQVPAKPTGPGKVFFGIVAYGNTTEVSYLHTKTIIDRETGAVACNTSPSGNLVMSNVLTLRSAYSSGYYRGWITSPVARTANLTWVCTSNSKYSGTYTMSIPANTETQVFGNEVTTNSGRIGDKGYWYGWLS